MNAYLTAMRNYATFTGRATRSDYWFFILILFGISILALLLDEAVSSPFRRSQLFLGIAYAAHLLPNFAVTARRLHDIDRSGWWLLLSFTVIGAIPVIYFLCQQGTPGPNRYGPAPAVPAGQPTPDGDHQTAPAGSARSLTDELERLSEMRTSGALSAAEFEVMKARLLARGA